MKSQVFYTPEIHEIIIKALEEGNTKTTAAKLSGINPQTLWDWCAEGRADPEKKPHLAKFAEDVDMARAKFEQSRVAIVTAAADSGTWQAAAWWLERTNPSEWGRHEKRTHELPPGGAPLIQLNQVVLDDPGVREQARDLLRRLAGSGAHESLGAGVRGELESANGTIDVDPRPSR